MIENTSVLVDWWMFGATLFSGTITAVATIGAVVYTNNRTKKQLVEQEQKFSQERKEENRQNKFITIQHKTLLKTFNNLLDRLIIDNDYYRSILFSGKDGFEFYDDFDKRAVQVCRMFMIDNPAKFETKDVSVHTETILKNLDNDQVWEYSTKNSANILRPGESIVVRLANGEQWKKIIEFNNKSCPNELIFKATIVYSTEALQRITYEYAIKILNDKKIEVLQDEIVNIENIEEHLNLKSSVYRNLQDSIANIDRASYTWEKQGQAQMKGLLSQYSPQQNNVDNSLMEAKDINDEFNG